MSTHPVWYCVLAVRDFRLLYLGTDEAAARACSGPGACCATAATMGDAQIQAALATGKMRRERTAANGLGRWPTAE